MNTVIAVLAFLASAWAIAFPAIAQQPDQKAISATAMASTANPAPALDLPGPGKYQVVFPSAIRTGRMVYYQLEVSDGKVFTTGQDGAASMCQARFPSRLVPEDAAIAIYVEPADERLALNCARKWIVRPAGGGSDTFEGDVPSGKLTIKKL